MCKPHKFNNTSLSNGPDRLTIFAFLWACQAIVHQEFYSSWLDEGNIYGWLLTIAALAVLLKPRSLPLFSVMLTISAVYNFFKWPFVVNHILVETLVNNFILGVFVVVVVLDRGKKQLSEVDQRNQIYDRFAPVVIWMLIIMYYFAFIAKLNYDFFEPDLSCVAAMYTDLVRRVPFVPTERWAKEAAIWSTVVIEAAIPLLLTFRRTKYLGVAIGLPFHLMLGLIGHRTFSALAFALYALVLMGPLTAFVGEVWQRVRQRVGATRLSRLAMMARVAVVLTFAFLIGADLGGHYESGIGPVTIYRVSWGIWILWSLVVAAIYLAAMWLYGRRPNSGPATPPAARPALLWAVLVLVVFNGMSQYLGLKTETCFTMYSNLRTEGGINNHLFMPALRLADYQDDLVEVIETDHPKLTKFVKKDQLITFFELRRVLSETQQDCSVTFLRGGTMHVFQRQGQQITHPELTEKHPTWQAKLLYFRPVPKGPRMCCQH